MVNRANGTSANVHRANGNRADVVAPKFVLMIFTIRSTVLNQIGSI